MNGESTSPASRLFSQHIEPSTYVQNLSLSSSFLAAGGKFSSTPARNMSKTTSMLDCDAGYGNQKKNERKQKRVYLVSMKELAKNNGVEVYSVIEAGV